MTALQKALSQLQDQFTISITQLNILAAQFESEMADGLAGKTSSLAMLPSWLTQPTGHEQGQYLALDFGGTNVRAFLVELTGQGQYRIHKRAIKPLADPSAGYDCTASSVTGTQLFTFVAELIRTIAPAGRQLALGHTFSFPCRQTSVNEAYLLYWTKEIAVSGVVGKNVTELLRCALGSLHLDSIQPVAVVNDTVTTLLTAAYADSCADIGSICGTGYNTCYLEPSPSYSSHPMYINIEAGNFDKVPANAFDQFLDKVSERPGAGRLEKMCSGRYLGELFRLACLHLAEQELVPAGSLPIGWQTPYSLTGEHMTHFLGHSDEEQPWLRSIAKLIAARSARLAAATWAAILNRIDPGLTRRHTIAIDGSLYEKMPGYAADINQALYELFGPKADQITCKLVKDGSGVGAAIAAAINTARPHF